MSTAENAVEPLARSARKQRVSASDFFFGQRRMDSVETSLQKLQDSFWTVRGGLTSLSIHLLPCKLCLNDPLISKDLIANHEGRLVSNEARDACNIPRIMFIEEKTSGICWTHLPRAFTARDVEERLAEVRSRRCLEEYLSISQAERSTTREILTTAGVNLVALEQLVAKILYDSDRSSLIESADECPAPQIPQDEPYMQHHNAYPVIKYEDPVKEPPTVIVLPIENQNEHPLSCEVDKKTRLDIVTYAVPNHVEHEDNSNLQNEAITYFVNTESGRSMITFDPISGFIKVSQIGRSEVYRSPNIPSQRSDKSVIWFGSAHDSDTSTLRMDKSSSIWGSDMDIHWNSEWTRSASVHGSHHEVWVRESYSLMEPIRAHVVPPPNSSLPPPSRLQRTLASSYPLPEVYFPGQNSSYLPPLSASAYYQGSAYPPIPSYPPAPSYSPSINKYFSLNNEFDQRSVRPLSSRFQLSDDNTVKNSAQNTTLNTVPANLSTRHEGVIHEKGRS